MTPPRIQTWLSPSCPKLDVFVPFLGKYHRPVSGRCCQTCTPRSWDGFYPKDLAPLGFRDASRLTEADTRFRGWLVRRVCGFLAAWEWEIPAESPGELLEQICSSRRVQDAASSPEPGSRGDEGSQRCCREEIRQILGEIQAPLSPLLLRLCHWLLPKLLTRVFLSVQLHRGQLEMVLQAARTPEVPLVFLCSHQSPLDGPLLSFLLLSQGVGLPRVAVSTRTSPRLRSLLQRLGGIFLPSGMAPTWSDRDEGLPGAVLDAYVQEVLRSRQPLVLFLEEPSALLRLAEPARRWLLRLLRALRDGAVPDALLVPVGIAYDVAPGGLERAGAPLGLGSCLRAAFQALRCQHRGCAQVDFSQPFSLRAPSSPSPGICGQQPGGAHPHRESPGAAAASHHPGQGPTGCEERGEFGSHFGDRRGDFGDGAGAACTERFQSLLCCHSRGNHRSAAAAQAPGGAAAAQADAGFLGAAGAAAAAGPGRELLGAAAGAAGAQPAPAAAPAAPPGLGPGTAGMAGGGGPAPAGRGGRGRTGDSPVPSACAIRALLLEMLPILGPPSSLTRIMLSRDELLHKILELLQLLPPTLLGLQPCRPPDCHSLDILDKLILGGLLEEEEAEGERWGCDVAPRRLGQGQFLGFFTDDSDSDSEHGVPKQCYKLREPQGFPGFLLFLCRLLSPVLQTYGRAVEFLQRPPWPQPEQDCVEALLEFLAEDEDGHPDRSLALSSLQSFKDMGVLEELQTPTGPTLQLSQPFQSASNREKLAAFIQQFTQL
ncbi:glycerol-3-phosphate acyltransferase 2, mitochondrial-like isoform X1 [Molothrus aeneus]|uniref:glycerol-3-phosphate acyltransferase 2, mitochondrial-like isoform X1 n=1 Tax=Molothrus aeneus TaxID=84833 RepID=UPI003457B866